MRWIYVTIRFRFFRPAGPRPGFMPGKGGLVWEIAGPGVNHFSGDTRAQEQGQAVTRSLLLSTFKGKSTPCPRRLKEKPLPLSDLAETWAAEPINRPQGPSFVPPCEQRDNAPISTCLFDCSESVLPLWWVRRRNRY
jgi:hypothetical protein